MPSQSSNTTDGRIAARLFAPSIAVMSRLRLAWKSAIIALILLAPLGYVADRYLSEQGTQISFAQKERVGVVYVRASANLLATLVDLRSTAVQVAAGELPLSALAASRQAVQQAIADVDDARAAARTLELTGDWTGLKAQIESLAARTPTDPRATFAAYDALATNAQTLITDTANNSNLILDPVLDSYYTMDAVVNQLTAVDDEAGRGADMQRVIAVTHNERDLDQRVNLSVLSGALQNNLGLADSDLQTAFPATQDKALRPTLAPLLAAVNRTMASVTSGLATAASTGVIDPAAATAAARRASAAAVEADVAGLPQLDRLLAARISRLEGTEERVMIVAAVAVLLALYLFAGFFLSFRGALSNVTERLRDLRDGCVAALSRGLSLTAEGNLTERIDVNVPEARSCTRDELSRVVMAVNDIREHMLQSVEAYNPMRGRVASMVSAISTTSEALSRSSEQMAATSEEMGRAIGEIAQSVGGVASGAEEQVRSVEEVRGMSGEVTLASQSSVELAQETAAAAQEARAAAEHGSTAVSAASDAMQAVRTTSEQVASAIRELAAKSEHIGGIVGTITSIAEQTNLLALNAAIEAARAGEQGRGFAVVADEVRKLAEDSQRAAASIGDVIAEIQADTGRAIEVVETSARQTEAGTATVDEARAAFDGIAAGVRGMSGRIEAIVRSAQQIAAHAARVHEAVESVADVAEQSSAATEQVSAATEQTTASTHETAASAHDVANTAEELLGLVRNFTLS